MVLSPLGGLVPACRRRRRPPTLAWRRRCSLSLPSSGRHSSFSSSGLTSTAGAAARLHFVLTFTIVIATLLSDHSWALILYIA